MVTTADSIGLFNEIVAADYIGVGVKCLQAYRQKGGGPLYVGISRRCVRYRRADLDAWAESKLRNSTSDTGPEVA